MKLKPMETRTECAARYCEKPVIQPGHLMCVHHWKMVPRPMQKEIYKWYRKGAEQDCHPLTEYTIHVNRAIKHVLDRERAMGGT